LDGVSTASRSTEAQAGARVGSRKRLAAGAQSDGGRQTCAGAKAATGVVSGDGACQMDKRKWEGKKKKRKKKTNKGNMNILTFSIKIYFNTLFRCCKVLV